MLASGHVTITSSSTLAQIEADIVDNGDYDLTDSIAKAKLFVHACRAWLVKKPTASAQEQHRLQFDVDQVRRMCDEAMTWLRNHPDFTAGDGVTTLADLRSSGA